MFQLLDDSFGYLVSFRITQASMREVIQRRVAMRKPSAESTTPR